MTRCESVDIPPKEFGVRGWGQEIVDFEKNLRAVGAD